MVKACTVEVKPPSLLLILERSRVAWASTTSRRRSRLPGRPAKSHLDRMEASPLGEAQALATPSLALGAAAPWPAARPGAPPSSPPRGPPAPAMTPNSSELHRSCKETQLAYLDPLVPLPVTLSPRTAMPASETRCPTKTPEEVRRLSCDRVGLPSSNLPRHPRSPARPPARPPNLPELYQVHHRRALHRQGRKTLNRWKQQSARLTASPRPPWTREGASVRRRQGREPQGRA
jgi:hypothetical protein